MPPPAAHRAASGQPRPAPVGQATQPTPPVQAPGAERESGAGSSILRWVVIVVLIGLGAAFGIWLGQLIIG